MPVLWRIDDELLRLWVAAEAARLTAELGDAGGQAASRYRLCLTVDGIETTSEPSESQGTFNGLPCFQEVITTTVDWKNAKIQRKEAGAQ